MDSLKDRLITAIIDYGNSEIAENFDAEDMAEYLMKVIDELRYSQQDTINHHDVIIDTYNNLMICPHCKEIIGTGSDWTPKFCKECGKPLTGGNQMPIE